MTAGALILGIATGIVGFVLTLLTGGGFLWALAAYMSIGSLVTVAVLIRGLLTGPATPIAWDPSAPHIA